MIGFLLLHTAAYESVTQSLGAINDQLRQLSLSIKAGEYSRALDHKPSGSTSTVRDYMIEELGKVTDDPILPYLISVNEAFGKINHFIAGTRAAAISGDVSTTDSATAGLEAAAKRVAEAQAALARFEECRTKFEEVIRQKRAAEGQFRHAEEEVQTKSTALETAKKDKELLNEKMLKAAQEEIEAAEKLAIAKDAHEQAKQKLVDLKEEFAVSERVVEQAENENIRAQEARATAQAQVQVQTTAYEEKSVQYLALKKASEAAQAILDKAKADLEAQRLTGSKPTITGGVGSTATSDTAQSQADILINGITEKDARKAIRASIESAKGSNEVTLVGVKLSTLGENSNAGWNAMVGALKLLGFQTVKLQNDKIPVAVALDINQSREKNVEIVGKAIEAQKKREKEKAEAEENAEKERRLADIISQLPENPPIRRLVEEARTSKELELDHSTFSSENFEAWTSAVWDNFTQALNIIGVSKFVYRHPEAGVIPLDMNKDLEYNKEIIRRIIRFAKSARNVLREIQLLKKAYSDKGGEKFNMTDHNIAIAKVAKQGDSAVKEAEREFRRECLKNPELIRECINIITEGNTLENMGFTKEEIKGYIGVNSIGIRQLKLLLHPDKSKKTWLELLSREINELDA